MVEEHCASGFRRDGSFKTSYERSFRQSSIVRSNPSSLFSFVPSSIEPTTTPIGGWFSKDNHFTSKRNTFMKNTATEHITNVSEDHSSTTNSTRLDNVTSSTNKSEDISETHSVSSKTSHITSGSENFGEEFSTTTKHTLPSITSQMESFASFITESEKRFGTLLEHHSRSDALDDFSNTCQVREIRIEMPDETKVIETPEANQSENVSTRRKSSILSTFSKSKNRRKEISADEAKYQGGLRSYDSSDTSETTKSSRKDSRKSSVAESRKYSVANRRKDSASENRKYSSTERRKDSVSDSKNSITERIEDSVSESKKEFVVNNKKHSTTKSSSKEDIQSTRKLSRKSSAKDTVKRNSISKSESRESITHSLRNSLKSTKSPQASTAKKIEKVSRRLFVQSPKRTVFNLQGTDDSKEIKNRLKKLKGSTELNDSSVKTTDDIVVGVFSYRKTLVYSLSVRYLDFMNY